MSDAPHHLAHHLAHRDDGPAQLALSLMAQSALARAAVVVGLLLLLWLAVIWAIALP